MAWLVLHLTILLQASLHIALDKQICPISASSRSARYSNGHFGSETNKPGPG